jgi:hypothetical protein
VENRRIEVEVGSLPGPKKKKSLQDPILTNGWGW